MKIFLQALLLVAAAAPPWSASPRRAETDAGCAVTLAGRGEVKLTYRTRPWDPVAVDRMRRDPADRERANQRLPLLVRGALSLPAPVRLGDLTLPVGEYRIALAMNAAGAWELSVLQDEELRPVPLQLESGGTPFPFLCFVLTPSVRGLCELVMHWGPDTGRVVLREAT